MPLRLEIISFQRERLGERRIKEFGIKGGTIGRSLESDWALEDSNRYLSGRHAAIDYRSGCYYIIDTSTNGVYVNDSHTPIGRTKPQRLFHGDHLRLGEYVMRVHVDDTNLDDDLDEAAHVDPVEHAQQAEQAAPTGYTLVSEDELHALAVEEILADDTAAEALKAAAEQAASTLHLVDDDVQLPAPELPPTPPKPSKPAPQLTPARAPRERHRAPRPEPQARKPAPTAASEAGDDQAGVYAFLRGAGLSPREMDTNEGAVLLHRAGQLIRELALGLRKVIGLRIEHRNLLRLANTTIQPRNNNLLNFAASLDEAIENLFFMDKPEYLPAAEAVRDAFDAVSAHERALLEATHAALLDYLERLDPQEIEQRFGDTRGGLLGTKNAPAKCWERYGELYATLTEHSPGHFPQMFIEAFAAAYSREINKRARTGGTGTAQGETG